MCKTFSTSLFCCGFAAVVKRRESSWGIKYGNIASDGAGITATELWSKQRMTAKQGAFHEMVYLKSLKNNNSVLYSVSGGGLWPHQISTFKPACFGFGGRDGRHKAPFSCKEPLITAKNKAESLPRICPPERGGLFPTFWPSAV